MKKYFILYTVFMFLAFLNLSGIESSGHFSFLEGDVKIVKTNGDMFKGKVNYPLVTGDVILTGKTGRCEIQLSNGTLLRLDKNSDIKLVSLLTESVTSNKKISIVKLMSGSVYTMAQVFGATVVMTQLPEPKQVLEVAEKHRATVIVFPPTVYVGLASTPGFKDCDLTSARIIGVWGSILPQFMIDSWYEKCPEAQFFTL